MTDMTPAILILGPSALPLARRLAALLPGAVITGPHARLDAAERIEVAPLEPVADGLRALFLASRPVIGIAAAGALIRMLAPVLATKATEPPVLAVAEDASVVVPLLGGHHGANDLARRIAGAIGAVAAITTAGDLRFGVALDDPPAGWRLAADCDPKPAMAALVAGAAIRLDPTLADPTWPDTTLPDWLAHLPQAADGAVAVVTSHLRINAPDGGLLYHPQSLAIGIGSDRGAPAAEIGRLIDDTLADAGLAPEAVALIVTIDIKADEAGIAAAAEARGLPVRIFPAARLAEEAPRLETPSAYVQATVGVAGVAEAAALAAAGPDGRLIVAKRRSARATCAVALAPAPIDIDRTGRAPGVLYVVGIGPGRADWRTPEVDRMVAASTDLVGYGLYLDLLGPAAAGKRRHGYELGEEERRVACALDLAAEGREVALVCSGDAGIYAMAALVYELIERGQDQGGPRPLWSRVRVRVSPGISALQAAAARAGAPLGHDFCAISLSDLMTPWPVIERRVQAAADGDFVVAFYNPVSRRRRHQLARAREILLAARGPATPVILARNLGRPDETVTVIELGRLDVDAVDMLTLVMVGARGTRRLDLGQGVRVYTPRGYGSRGEEVA
ncbi:precorrin-3B C(17)-methyltransferase [Tistrella bauzanensis]|uniref:precorrin-3B C(17)-methyltransferase n=1 Tax=Tistrella TaxID=171436 RepID=UPI0031F61ED6